MDRAMAPGGSAATTPDPLATILPSRRAALDRLRAAMARGPVLISGEPGSGKTWAARRLLAESGVEAVEVAITPSMTFADLSAELADQLGLAPGSTRQQVDRRFAELAVDGPSPAILCDEVQNASPALVEEIRILSGRIGRRGGPSSVVLVAQTSIVPRLRSDSLRLLESRLAAHAHLPRIDADEAASLLGPGHPTDAVDSWHRASAGNPARLLRLAALEMDRLDDRPSAAPLARPADPLDAPLDLESPLLPTRPPLREEDGLIEVGWDAEAEAEVEAESAADPNIDEAVADRYASIQAATERSRIPAYVGAGFDADADADAESDRDIPAPRPDGQHTFTPYSQLFAHWKRSSERPG